MTVNIIYPYVVQLLLIPLMLFKSFAGIIWTRYRVAVLKLTTTMKAATAVHILLYLALLSSVSIKLVVCQGLGDNIEVEPSQTEPDCTCTPAITDNGCDPTGGLSVGITNNELNHIAEIGAKVMEKEVTGHRIDRVSIDNIGLVKDNLDMTDITVTSLKIPNASISTNSSKIRPSVEVDTNLTMNWEYCINVFGKVCDRGFANVDATASLSTNMNITMKNGHYNLDLDQCESGISKLKTVIGGSPFASLYNLILPWFEEPMTREVQRHICPQVKNEVMNHSSDVVDSFQNDTCVDDISCIDFSLTNSPVVNEDFVATTLKGEFFSQINRTDHPFDPDHVALSPPVNHTHCNYYFHTTEYTIKSALDVYFQSQRLQHAFCLPKMTKNLLSNKLLKFMALFTCTMTKFNRTVQPTEDCSNNYVVYINTTSNPTTRITPSKLSVNFSVTVDLVKGRMSLCAMNFVAMADVNVSIRTTPTGHNITGNITSFDTSISNNELCPLLRFALSCRSGNVATVVSLLDEIAHTSIVPLLNAKLERGFALPEFKYIILVHPTIHLNEGYTTTCFDVDYCP